MIGDGKLPHCGFSMFGWNHFTDEIGNLINQIMMIQMVRDDI